MFFLEIQDIFIVVINLSPPNIKSAIARAVSVFPTPLGPTNKNTPAGEFSFLILKQLFVRKY